MTNPTLERAENALRDEVERQVQAQGAYSGPENERPDYVDAYLDYPALARAVLMAVREPDEATVEAIFQARDGFVDKQDIVPLHRLVIDFALGESNETDDLTKSAVVSQEGA